MHQTRSKIIRVLPLARKGTKYVARASRNESSSVPLVIAIRDMLKLAKTSKEVKGMVHNKILKINGKLVKTINDPIGIFSIIEADKKYLLTLLPTGRFVFEETKENSRRLKIMGKRLVKKGLIQYSLQDGTSILSKQNFSRGDTLILDFENKIVKHKTLENGKEIFVFSGSNIGITGKIKEFSKNKVTIKFDKDEIIIDNSQVIVL